MRHGQNPVIAFTPVDHVPCRATVEQTTAIKFAIDAVEIRLALKIRKANRISLRERMTGAGFVTSAATAGTPAWRIKAQTGHVSDALVGRYIRLSDPFAANVESLMAVL